MADAERLPGTAPRVSVVGIGASAGGLEALERLFASIPPDAGLAYVVVQHLSPDHKSLMVELLSKHTAMSVRKVEDDVEVEPDTVYLLPPKKNVVLKGDRLRLADRPPGHGVPLPVDIFFMSLAEAQGEDAIAVVLSGTGSDGMRGVRAIKEAGGTVLAQDEASARFDGMPRAAISTGLVDAVLPPEQMGAQLAHLAKRDRAHRLDTDTDEGARDYGRVLEQLRRESGVDFTHYKSSSVLRRIERRMGVCGVADLAAYADILAGSPYETRMLYKDLLIGVTRFFRDPAAWELLRAKVVEPLVQSARWDQQLRVWVAGCSTGEEAYSLGILFLEAMEAAGRRVPLKIFATDIDREALEVASSGAYADALLADLSPERLGRHFVRRGDRYVVGRELRSLVLFASHNLARDPPFTRMDLVTSRNLLIYLDNVLQQRIIGLLHYALNPGRFLWLGPSETIGASAEHFRAVDTRWKVYQAQGAPRAALGDVLLTRPLVDRRRPVGTGDGPTVAETADEVTRWLLAEYVPTSLLVSPEGELVHVFGDPNRFLSVPTGRPTTSVGQMLERPLGAAVSTAVHQAHHQHREVRYEGVRTSESSMATAHVRAVPFAGREAAATVLVVIGPEAPGAPALAPESMDRAAEERLADLQAELRYTKESLQATIEELETSNEELQATNEELLSSNEELQSTNEELQSVNEELHTVNHEFQAKIAELSDLNADLDNFLRSTEIGTLFLDESLCIRRFTPPVTRLIRVIARDVGRPIEHLSTWFDGHGFLDALREVLDTGRARQLDVVAADGGRFLVRILPYEGGVAKGLVVTFVDVTAAALERDRLQAVVDALPEHVAVLDVNGTITLVNRSWRRFAEENGGADDPRHGVGADYLAVCAAAGGPDAEAARAVGDGLRRVLLGLLTSFSLEYPCDGPGQPRWFVVHAAPMPPAFGGAVVSHIDVSARRRSAHPNDGGPHGGS